jgi:hypothetical protein
VARKARRTDAELVSVEVPAPRDEAMQALLPGACGTGSCSGLVSPWQPVWLPIAARQHGNGSFEP